MPTSLPPSFDDDQLAALVRAVSVIPIEQRAPLLAQIARAILTHPDADLQALLARLIPAACNVAAEACTEGDDVARWEGDDWAA
jgi:hypothetical protein